MKKVLTVGVFDYFHFGHLRLFKNAKALGDYLIVAVQDENYILKYKPKASIFYSIDQRIDIVKELRCVDEVVIYTAIDEFIKTIDFDVFAVGEDQTHEGFMRAIAWCNEHGKKVVRMTRTPNISSSGIKESIQ